MQIGGLPFDCATAFHLLAQSTAVMRGRRCAPGWPPHQATHRISALDSAAASNRHFRACMYICECGLRMSPGRRHPNRTINIVVDCVCSLSRSSNCPSPVAIKRVLGCRKAIRDAEQRLMACRLQTDRDKKKRSHNELSCSSLE